MKISSRSSMTAPEVSRIKSPPRRLGRTGLTGLAVGPASGASPVGRVGAWTCSPCSGFVIAGSCPPPYSATVSSRPVPYPTLIPANGRCVRQTRQQAGAGPPSAYSTEGRPGAVQPLLLPVLLVLVLSLTLLLPVLLVLLPALALRGLLLALGAVLLSLL